MKPNGDLRGLYKCSRCDEYKAVPVGVCSECKATAEMTTLKR